MSLRLCIFYTLNCVPNHGDTKRSGYCFSQALGLVESPLSLLERVQRDGNNPVRRPFENAAINANPLIQQRLEKFCSIIFKTVDNFTN